MTDCYKISIDSPNSHPRSISQNSGFSMEVFRAVAIGGFQPIPGDPKDNGVAAMLDDRTCCFIIQHGRHAIVFLHLQGLVANHL